MPDFVDVTGNKTKTQTWIWKKEAKQKEREREEGKIISISDNWFSVNYSRQNDRRDNSEEILRQSILGWWAENWIKYGSKPWGLLGKDIPWRERAATAKTISCHGWGWTRWCLLLKSQRKGKLEGNEIGEMGRSSGAFFADSWKEGYQLDVWHFRNEKTMVLIRVVAVEMVRSSCI